MADRLLAVVPARGGSKGIPGKNLRSLAGLPLVVHALRFTALCPEIVRTVVSTDSEEIAAVARDGGGEVNLLRPAELAQDDTPIWPVLRHALEELDPGGEQYERLLLVTPASPFRLPEDVSAMSRMLDDAPDADGVVAVSDPGFNPVFVSVVERDGFMAHLVPDGSSLGRRQDAPRVLRITGALYLWHTAFVRREPLSWFNGRNRMYEMPDARVADIDEPRDLELCELLLANGLVTLPWL